MLAEPGRLLRIFRFDSPQLHGQETVAQGVCLTCQRQLLPPHVLVERPDGNQERKDLGSQDDEAEDEIGGLKEIVALIRIGDFGRYEIRPDAKEQGGYREYERLQEVEIAEWAPASRAIRMTRTSVQRGALRAQQRWPCSDADAIPHIIPRKQTNQQVKGGKEQEGADCNRNIECVIRVDISEQPRHNRSDDERNWQQYRGATDDRPSLRGTCGMHTQRALHTVELLTRELEDASVG